MNVRLITWFAWFILLTVRAAYPGGIDLFIRAFAPNTVQVPRLPKRGLPLITALCTKTATSTPRVRILNTTMQVDQSEKQFASVIGKLAGNELSNRLSWSKVNAMVTTLCWLVQSIRWAIYRMVRSFDKGRPNQPTDWSITVWWSGKTDINLFSLIW